MIGQQLFREVRIQKCVAWLRELGSEDHHVACVSRRDFAPTKTNENSLRQSFPIEPSSRRELKKALPVPLNHPRFVQEII
jgi:hypothetical protein